ncbi:MAG: AAA family ATPase [Spirochaetales bacterium]|nr:AAA family ATPase [Spirochaetales bacterium]
MRSNEHIKEYCKKFIESPENPHFALFIKGDWGTGKTYFIEKLIEEYTDQTEVKKSEIIKISLFGVQTFEDIDLKIYQALHPILSSKYMKLAGAVLRSVVKLRIGCDLNSDGKNNLSIFTDGINALFDTKKESSFSTKLLIVDDFERALMKPCEIFGYFSEIITESDTKVIFIGNEEKIENKDKYLQIKEKIIGMEFQIEPVFDEAIEQFVIDIPFTEETKSELKAIVKNIAINLNCRNLRIIRQSLYNLNLFIEVINSFEEEDQQNAIIVFLILFIQKSLKTISITDDISKVIKAYFHEQISYLEYLNKHYKDIEYCFLYDRVNYIPLLRYWHSIIFDGNYQTEFLTSEYKNEKKQIEISQTNQRKKLFVLLDTWSDMDNEVFRKTIMVINKEFESGEYLNIGEILHYANIMIIFARLGLIAESVDKIQSRISEFLNFYHEQIIPVKDWIMLQMGYGGFSFNIEGLESMEFYDKLKKINEDNIYKQSKLDINNDINLIEKEITVFCKNIILANGNNKYYDQPILSFLDIDSFYEVIQSLPVRNQEIIISAFEERYGKSYSNEPFNSKYIADYINLKKLAKKYTSNNQDFLYNPQAYFKDKIAKRWLELVAYFEKKDPNLLKYTNVDNKA